MAALAFVVAAILLAATATVASDPQQPRITPALLAALALEENTAATATANVMITMRARPAHVIAQAGSEASSTLASASRGARISSLRTALQEHAQVTQAPVLELLSKNDVLATGPVRSFWISNQIYVPHASWSLVQLLANNSGCDISEIDVDRIVKPEPLPFQSSPAQRPGDKATPEFAQWGVVTVKAPRVWESTEFGSDGSGVTVGIIDSGVRWTHEALRDNYLNDGHSWLDPHDQSATPRDGHGHGTHVAGTILGQGGIGVAPGAKWIACKGLDDQNAGTGATLLACGEFMFCPTDPRGEGADCDRAPHVVSNSWGGGQGEGWYNDVITAWHSAGIIPVFSIGNSGAEGCRSAGSPGDQLGVISVGATTISDSLAPFSSLGPSLQGSRKPEISAPGHNIVSANAIGDGLYATMSGTSMAAPHVAGVVALLLSHKPGLQYHNVKSILEATADHDLTFNHDADVCGGLPNSVFPNNHFGHGRINAYRALQESSHYSHAPAPGRGSPSLTILLFSVALTSLFQGVFNKLER